MMKSTTRNVSGRWLALGLVISLGFVALILQSIDLSRSWQILVDIDGQRFWLPAVITVGAIPLRPWRWQIMFLPTTRPKWVSCFGTLAAGNMANNILPGRGGDLLRCFLISGSRSLRAASAVLGTLALEKICDALALLTVVVLSCFLITPPVWLWRLGVVASVILTVTVVVLVLMGRRSSRLLGSLFHRIDLGALGDKLVDLYNHFLQGLSAARSNSRLSSLALLTLLVWIAEAAVLWSLAFTLRIPLSLFSAAFVSATLGLGLMIPAGPGFVGTYEFFAVAALSLFGIGAESALALTLLMHVWSVLATTILGIIGLTVIQANFSDLFASQATTSSANLAR